MKGRASDKEIICEIKSSYRNIISQRETPTVVTHATQEPIQKVQVQKSSTTESRVDANGQCIIGGVYRGMATPRMFANKEDAIILGCISNSLLEIRRGNESSETNQELARNIVRILAASENRDYLLIKVSKLISDTYMTDNYYGAGIMKYINDTSLLDAFLAKNADIRGYNLQRFKKDNDQAYWHTVNNMFRERLDFRPW